MKFLTILLLFYQLNYSFCNVCLTMHDVSLEIDPALKWSDYSHYLKSAFLPMKFKQIIRVQKECKGVVIQTNMNLQFTFQNAQQINQSFISIKSTESTFKIESLSNNVLETALKFDGTNSQPNYIELEIVWKEDMKFRSDDKKKINEAKIEQSFPVIKIKGDSFDLLTETTRLKASVTCPKFMKVSKNEVLSYISNVLLAKYSMSSKHSNSTIMQQNFEMTEHPKKIDLRVEELLIKVQLKLDISLAVNFEKASGYCADQLKESYYHWYWIVLSFVVFYFGLNMFFTLDTALHTHRIPFGLYIMYTFKLAMFIFITFFMVAIRNNSVTAACHGLFSSYSHPYLMYTFWIYVTPLFFIMIYGLFIFSIMGNENLDLISLAVINLEEGKTRSPKAQQATNWLKLLISRSITPCIFIALTILNYQLWILDSQIIGFFPALFIGGGPVFICYLLRPVYVYDFKWFSHNRSVVGIFGMYFIGLLYRLFYQV